MAEKTKLKQEEKKETTISKDENVKGPIEEATKTETINVEEKTDKKIDADPKTVENKVEKKRNFIKKSGRSRNRHEPKPFDVDAWKPKTGMGEKVKSKEILELDYILNNGLKIMEAEIVDALIPTLEKDLLLIGQSKGKFGGGQRRVFKQTQKKTPEGNKPRFASFAVIGNRDGFVGVGYGKSKETVPAREKSFRNAKIGIIKINRGCGSWQCGCKSAHSIPFMVEGKCGSSIIKLMPAPKGTGLCAESSCARILELAGIKDIWSKTFGQTKSKINLIKACMDALGKLTKTKIKPHHYELLGIVGEKKND